MAKTTKRRSKRAAAVVAETKIKKVVEKINGSDEVNERQEPAKVPAKLPMKRDPAKGTQLKSKCSSKKMKPGVGGGGGTKKKKSTYHEENHRSDDDDTFMTSSDDFSFKSSSTSSLFSNSRTASTMRAHLAHLRRRAARQVNSTGPMILSRRTSYRISSGSTDSPGYSPIVAAKLSFTPVE